MPPRSEVVPVSTLKIKHPNRNSALSAISWLKEKQKIDGAENLWRIHDNLYDVTPFVKKHPGGAEWLELTKGTDITEAFEVHHLTTIPEGMLEKYFVRKAKSKRNSPFTFKDDGFYKTLKREVMAKLTTIPKQPMNTSRVFTDSLLLGLFVFSILAVSYWNYWLVVLAAMFLGLLTIASHNYFHQKDNFRMLYFNFSMMQVREWRISHVLSHHLHTNTIDDLEIIMNEPIMQYLPHEKTTIGRYGPWFYFPIFWALGFPMSFLKRVYHVAKGDADLLQWYDFIPWTLPLAMYTFGGQSLVATLWIWQLIVLAGSFHFFAVGFNAAHHHPDIFHDGDTPRSDTDYDWGLSQLDSIMDRHDITGSHFLVLTNFGDHALHHFFPTLDHGTLEHLYPMLKDVCEKFNVKLRMASQLELLKGSFLQLARCAPNPNPPDLSKIY